jgi:hypothetical protein
VRQINPVSPSTTTSGAAPMAMAMTGVPQAMDSAITSPKGSGQRMGNRGGGGLPNQDFLVCLTHLSQKLNLLPVNVGSYLLIKKGLVLEINLASHF